MLAHMLARWQERVRRGRLRAPELSSTRCRPCPRDTCLASSCLSVFFQRARSLSLSLSLSLSMFLRLFLCVCVCLSLPLVSVSLPSLSNSALPSQHTVRPQCTVAWQPTALSQFVGRRALSSAAHKKPMEAGSEGGKAAPLFPMHKKGDNLFDLLGLCDYYGVGYKAARKWWAARYPDSYWIITKVMT